MDHVCVNYIDSGCSFPTSLWNQYDNDNKRTNNDVEGYNSKLNKFIKKHPSIWLFILKIREESCAYEVDYCRLELGELRLGRNKVDIERDLKMQLAKCSYLQNEYSIMEYLDKVSEVVQEFD